MPDYKEVRIFHPGTKGEALVPESSLPTWYRSGWTRVTADPPAADESVPEPVTESQVADAKAPKTASSKTAKEQ